MSKQLWEASLDGLQERILKLEEHLRERIGACHVAIHFNLPETCETCGKGIMENRRWCLKCGATKESRMGGDSHGTWILSWGRSESGWCFRLGHLHPSQQTCDLLKMPAKIRLAGTAKIPQLMGKIEAEAERRIEQTQTAIDTLDGLIDEYGQADVCKEA